MNGARALAVFVVVMLGSTNSFGQQIGAILPSTPAVQFGPLSLYPSVTLHDVGIDSNVYNDSNIPKDDFTFAVTPRLQAVLRMGITRLTGVAGADFVFYQKYKDQQSVNNNLEGRFEIVSPARLRPFVDAARVRTRDRSGFEIDARALRFETIVTAGADFEITSVTALTGWAQHGTYTFAEGEEFLGVSLPEQLDRTSNVAAAGVKLSLTPFTTVTVSAEVVQDRFATSPLRDSDSLRVAPTVEFAPGGVLSGRASAGFRQFTPADPRLPEYRGFVASVGVGYTLLGRTQFDVQANRDVSYSFIETDPYYLAVGGTVTVTQRIVGPFDLVVLGSRQRLHYQELEGEALAGRIETTTSAGGGIGVHVGERMRLTLTYDRTRRTSTELGQLRNYERRRLLSSVSIGL